MKTTPDGRPYAILSSRQDGSAIDVHPDLLEILLPMTGNGLRCDGQVTIQIVRGEMTEVRMNAPAGVWRKLASRH
jgi:hypothetical protein